MGAIFITFPGNCKKALTFYQSCFGGTLKLEHLGEALQHYSEMVVSGSLLSDTITIYGSDLVHSEGRKLGNYMAIFLGCKNVDDRKELIAKLVRDKKHLGQHHKNQALIEVTDAFEVRWVLGVNGE